MSRIYIVSLKQLTFIYGNYLEKLYLLKDPDYFPLPSKTIRIVFKIIRKSKAIDIFFK